MLNSTDKSDSVSATAVDSNQPGNMKKILRLSRALKINGAICFALAATATVAMADLGQMMGNHGSIAIVRADAGGRSDTAPQTHGQVWNR